jgi:hypothetical protein
VDDDEKEEEKESGTGKNQVEKEEEEKDDEDNGDDDDSDTTTTTTTTTTNSSAEKITSNQPVRILVNTAWGNSVLDRKLELNALRTRSMADLKKSISKQLPGKPPILSLELVFGGRILSDDDMLVDELFEDDEEEDGDDAEDEDGDGIDEPHRSLVLNIVPPVEAKFATELLRRLREESHSDDYLSTQDLIDAYYLNQVAMGQNSKLLVNPSSSSSSTTSSSSSTTLLRLEMQAQAKLLQEQLQRQTPELVWQKALEPVVSKSHTAEERRGQRYRSGKGGARTNLKKSLQHNFNVVRFVFLGGDALSLLIVSTGPSSILGVKVSFVRCGMSSPMMCDDSYTISWSFYDASIFFFFFVVSIGLGHYDS